MFVVAGLLTACVQPGESVDMARWDQGWDEGSQNPPPPAADPSLIPNCRPNRKAFVNGVGFPTYIDAMANSASGSVVQLCPGVHVGAPTVVNYPVFLVGMTGDRDDVEIEGGTMVGPFFPRVDRSRFGMSNLTFRDYTGVETLIWIDGDDGWTYLTLYNVKFIRNLPGVMSLIAAADVVVRDAQFEDNGFISDGRGGVAGSAPADARVVVENSGFTRNCAVQQLFNFKTGSASNGYVYFNNNLFENNDCPVMAKLIQFNLDDSGQVVRFSNNRFEENYVYDAMVDYAIWPPTVSNIVIVGDSFIGNETGNTILRLGLHIPPPSPSMVNNVSYLGELQFHNNIVADAMVEVHRRQMAFIRNSDFGVGPTDNVVVDEEVEIAGCAGWYTSFDNPVWLYLNGHRSTCRLFTSPP